tara:strand:- start:23 stop:550 length:528 start_codon:yes stop_codon:yes gene_type:complete
MKKIIVVFLIFITNSVFADGYDVFGIGYYDVKFDGTDTMDAVDFRYERRFDKSLLQIGPESYDFFDIKPFVGFEGTSDSAAYFLVGIYLDDNVGTLLTGKTSNFLITPSIGVGAYDDGDGKKLGHTIEFRSTVEASYQLKNKHRIGLSIGHISNANLGNKNPGVEILSLSYQIPY